MNRSTKFALVDTAIYIVFIICMVGVLIVGRTTNDADYLNASKGLLDPSFLFTLITSGAVTYGLKVFLLSLIYRSGSSSDYLLKGMPLRYGLIGFYLVTIITFLYLDWVALQVVYTTLTAENTVQGLVTWFVLAAQIAIFATSSVVALVLLSLSGRITKKHQQNLSN